MIRIEFGEKYEEEQRSKRECLYYLAPLFNRINELK
jgi:hypothetical protein